MKRLVSLLLALSLVLALTACGQKDTAPDTTPVSYTHLTLPTKLEV